MDPSGGLTKFAEAAGRKMKKLRRNWSLRKNDITRSLSRIKKTNFPSDLPGRNEYLNQIISCKYTAERDKLYGNSNGE